MTTYGDLSTVGIGTRVIFVGDVGINYHPDTGEHEFMIPNGTIMFVVENVLLEPTETIELRPEDSDFYRKIVNEFSPTGTIRLGPDSNGASGRAETAPVDII